MPFPDIDPVAIQIGPLAIRWYALSYIAGLVLGWLLVRRLVTQGPLWGQPADGRGIATKEHVDDLLVWAALGVILGGRLGHVLFYGLVLNPDYYLANPLRIFFVWEGGMSFHGGLLGVILAIVLFCRRHQLALFRVGDAVACAAPIGLFFGRIANFINGEIWGKPTDVPWGVVFPNALPPGVPRHPSQLYEAFLEGAVLFGILMVFVHKLDALRRPGYATGVFLVGYSFARIFVEVFYRDSNNKLGDSGLTIGIVLSLPMLAAGAAFLWHAFKRAEAEIAAPVPPPLAKSDGAK